MNKQLLSFDIQNYIDSNLNSDITSILLKGTKFPLVETKEIVEQIEAKKRCQNKLKTWFISKNIYYPNKLNIEQTSSEITAKYKSEIIKGDSIIDITGGFGVDCFYFAKHFNQVTHCEINTTLSEIVAHNHKQLGINNVQSIALDGLHYLNQSKTTTDWIYIDPSRRNDNKGKVFFLKDCLPNVPGHIDFLLKKTNNILIKTSPLLDITIGLKELKHVKQIHIVAVNNEVKELLWVLKKGYNEGISIETINLKSNKKEEFNFILDEEQQYSIAYGDPQTYLYEPNAAIMKSGAFHYVAKKFNLKKLHKHSHLYTSDALIEFPGRVFRINKTMLYNKKLLKKEFLTKANISTRNFLESVAQIRSRYNIKDGGDNYLFFTTNYLNSKIVLICKKLN